MVAVIAVFLWCRRVCTLAVLLVPCFLSPVWGWCLGCGCGFAWFAGGFSGVVLLPCGCVYPSVCALLLGRVCLGWGWCVCGRVGVFSALAFLGWQLLVLCLCCRFCWCPSFRRLHNDVFLVGVCGCGVRLGVLLCGCGVSCLVCCLFSCGVCWLFTCLCFVGYAMCGFM